MNIGFLSIFLILLRQSNGANILLVSPNLANSMVLYAGRMADVLQKAGHNVVGLIYSILTMCYRRYLSQKCAVVLRK